MVSPLLNAFPTMVKHRSTIIRFLLVLFIIVYATFFIQQLFLRYYTFSSRSLDLGNMDQAIWNTLHGRPYHQTNQPGIYNRLSLHVEPILAPISLLYLIYSGPETLFVLQTVVVALGAIPVFALARLKLKNEGLALIFALAYLMYPALQAANILDFHAVTMAPTFLLAAFYTLETNRLKWFALFAVLAISCKEEIALIVMMMGLYALLFKQQRKLGLITMGASLGWAFVAVFVIPPMFVNTENIHWGRYNHLGDSPADILLNFIVQPQLLLNHLREVNVPNYFRLLLAPTAYTALFSPHLLLLALPSLGINLLSNFPPMQQVNTLIYAASIIPAVFISSIFGATVIIRLLNHKLHHLRSLTCLLLGVLVLFATLVYHEQYGFFPGGGQFRGWPLITNHHRNAARILAQIPPDAALAAHDRLNPHVSQRETLHIFDGSTDGIDHIVLDVTADSWPLHPIELRHQVDDYLRGDFGIVDAYDGYLLLAKGQPELPVTLPDEFFNFARVPNPDNFSPQYPVSVTFDNKIRLLGYDLSLGAYQDMLPVITLYWQALEPLEQDYALWPFFTTTNGQLIEDPSERPLVATLWYPTSQWTTQEIIQTPTLPWDLGDEFVLNIGITMRNQNEIRERLLPITQVDAGLYTFENNTWARLGAFQKTGRAAYKVIPSSSTHPQQPMQAQFWNLIALQGVDLPPDPLPPGSRLPFTLYWQTNAPLTVDLKTFAHLLDEQGNMVAQLDWTPQDSLGNLPTTAWQAGRQVVDHQIILLPDPLPPGQYRLIAGWYYPVTGDRLPVTAGGSGDTLEIGLITIR
jgi:uncharacterized membrane protein